MASRRRFDCQVPCRAHRGVPWKVCVPEPRVESSLKKTQTLNSYPTLPFPSVLQLCAPAAGVKVRAEEWGDHDGTGHKYSSPPGTGRGGRDHRVLILITDAQNFLIRPELRAGPGFMLRDVCSAALGPRQR